jgi:hypothetical protein
MVATVTDHDLVTVLLVLGIVAVLLFIVGRR